MRLRNVSLGLVDEKEIQEISGKPPDRQFIIDNFKSLVVDKPV